MELYHLSGPHGSTASRLYNTILQLFSKPTTSPETPQNPTHDSRRLDSRPTSLSENPPLIMFILGAPGAGKETHSKRLRRDFGGLTHLSYGDVLRYQASIPASWVGTFPRRDGGVDGDPVLPAADAVDLLRNTIDSGVARGQRTWLMDGFPRSKEHMDAWAGAQMPRARCAFYLDCDGEVLVSRILGRAAASGRPSDAQVEVVRERVERNIRASETMLQACRDCDVPVVKIDADRDLDAVYCDIKRHFKVSLRVVCVIH
ncbi:P-loop containing nucleoside triphosphate hydrolase protein [Xylaria longipes]|nr:P-loop containing nucleoside triphosphate hydrolase protein [Xylaria longipes]